MCVQLRKCCLAALKKKTLAYSTSPAEQSPEAPELTTPQHTHSTASNKHGLAMTVRKTQAPVHSILSLYTLLCVRVTLYQLNILRRTCAEKRLRTLSMIV